MAGGGWEGSHGPELSFGCQLGSSVLSAGVWEDQAVFPYVRCLGWEGWTARTGWARRLLSPAQLLYMASVGFLTLRVSGLLARQLKSPGRSVPRGRK